MIKDGRNYILGIFLVFTGVLMPSLIGEYHFSILDLISESASINDSGVLLLAAIRLVFLNTLRAVPHYLGAFIIVNEIKNKYENPNYIFLYSPLLLIPLVYFFIERIYLIEYDFGSPAYLSMVLILMLYFFTKEIDNYTVKFIIVFLFIFSFQWLDVMPALSPFHFGRGELSLTIKSLSEILNASYILNFFGLIFFLIIIISALIISRIYIGNYRRVEAVKESRDKEIQLKQMRLKRVEDRVDKEMRYLVHDLKTPLTTIRGLNDVIYYSSKNEEIKEHTKQIDQAANNINNIILEITHKDVQTKIAVKVFVKMLKNQLSGENYSGIITIENEAQGEIKANKMRLIRAVVNLVDNAMDSIRDKYKDEIDSKGKVVVHFFCDTNMLVIKISDNGIGIEKNNIEKFKITYTRKLNQDNSDFLGIGIEFVKKVINEHDGLIDVKSNIGVGTDIYIYIPLETN